MWQRVAALCGLAFVLLTLAGAFVAPSTPDADEATSELVRVLVDDRERALAFALLLSLLAGVFVVFAAVLHDFLRAGEHDIGAAVAFAGALGTSLVLLLSQAVLAASVHAADNGREPAAVRALFELSTPLYTSSGLTLALFFAGVAASTLPSRALPRWLGWTAAAAAAAFLLGVPGVLSEDESGGVLGIFFFVGELLALIWVAAASVVLWRRSGRGTAEAADR